MPIDPVLESISADLAAGRTEGLSAKLLAAAESCSEPFEMLKCISILKLLPQDGTESKIANLILNMTDEGTALEVAKALYSLDCPYFALEALKKAPKSDHSYRLICSCQYALDEYESALETYSKIADPCVKDRILLSSIDSNLGEHKMAVDIATQLLSEYPDDYDVRIAYVNSMMMAGNTKDVAKYIRNGVKDKTADSYAVAAYVLRIQGNIKAAGGYASRAVTLNNNHIGAMETLGICLAIKSEYDKAKIVAGAINEISPGDKAAINILSYCEGH